MPRHEDLDDRLDALLDGHEALVTREMAPLLEAAAALRASLAPLRLDPASTRRHLREALAGGGGGTGPGAAAASTAGASPSSRSRARHARSRRSRRAARGLATLALAATLLLTPLVLLAGGALPGDPLYPVKLATEQARVTALAWSPPHEASLRAQLAATRLDELEQLAAGGQYQRLPAAIVALDAALDAAEQAVAHDPRTDALLGQRLAALQRQRVTQLSGLLRRLPATTPTAARARLQDAVRRSLEQQR